MTIYVLTDGDYSDYHIIGCFSTNELAEKAAKVLGGSVEEYELDEVGKDNRWSYHIHMDSNGNIESTMIQIQQPKEKAVGHYKDYSHQNEIKFWAEVLAEDKDHAIKIAADKIRQYRVENNL